MTMIYSKVLFTLVIFSNLSIAERGNWLDPVKDEPKGTYYKSFFSPTIQGDVSYLVYLPPDYETTKSRGYPVVYWLHGGGGNQRTGDNFVERLNDAICCGAAPAMIAVLVNGVGSSLFCDSIDGKKPVETVIVKDLIPHIDATYRTYGTGRMRAVEGFSMGGFGALHLAFKYPHLFGAVTALAHAPIRPDSGWPKVDRVWKTGPLAGNVEYFRKNDPFQLVEKNSDTIRQGMRIRLIVGDADNPNTVARTRELYDKMAGLNLTSELIVIPGIRHSYKNLYEELGDKEFSFYKEVFAGAPSIAGTPIVGKPLTDMTAEDRYKSEEGGLYGGGKNSPPEAHLKAALAEAAKILPLDAKGQPSPNGKIVLMTHGMSNTNLESLRFIELANAIPLKNPALVLINGAQGGMDSRKWVEDKHTRSGASPWDRLEQRIKSAGVTPRQVQVIWMKHAISMKHNAARGKRFGEFPNHAQQLKDDMAQLISMLKKRYPNLKLVYVSSRSYAGYAATTLNPEPYAYESAFAVRWLIQDQIKSMESLRYTAGKVPLLLWGPYLWANGEKGRNYDDLVYRREDFRDDGTHPSDAGQQKIAEQLLKFFKTDPTAKTWFLKH
jgi:S-formylglutathione hydrolase FrmB